MEVINSDVIQDTFNRLGLKWWVDSGSLLGLVRDDHFLENDRDIDIGVVSENNEKLNKLIDFFLSNGFRVVKFYWGEALYKCKIIPYKNNYEYILDIQLYTFDKVFYICPQMVFKKDLSVFNKIRKKSIRLKKSNLTRKKIGLISKIYTALTIKKIVRIQAKKKNNDSLFDCYVWRIEPKYIKNSFKCLHGFPVFEKSEEYLAYRYGDWKTPISKWNFVVDDKSIAQVDYLYLDKVYNENSK